MDKKAPTALVILDGFGFSNETKYNAIFHAKKLNLDNWFKNYPYAILHASGKYVGLPDNFIGNSEVGHQTIGSGQRITQPITIINQAIEDGSFFKNDLLINNLEKLSKINGNLHIMGLLSDAGVHSYEKHLFAYIKIAEQQKIKNIFIHAFLDGRDTAPKSAFKYLNNLENFIKTFNNNKNIEIGSLTGRFYAMDRDQNWNRTEKCYKIIAEPGQIKFSNWQQALEKYYYEGLSDEFIPPTQFDNNAIVKNGDGIVFFNFREDRARQLTSCFVQKDFKFFHVKKIKLAFFITPVSYDHDLDTVVLFKTEKIQNTLSDILAKNKFTVFYIAETEKYAHVTYFFRGGREKALPNETQVLIPSLHAKNYVANPCMSAPEITEAILESLKNDPKDFYVINYANADMVGHSGNFDATVKAVECVDKQLGLLYNEFIEKLNGTMYITADHGKAELMFDVNTGQPDTAHTTNPVPFLMINKKLKGQNNKLNLHELADIMPFILKNLNIKF